jgi:hypothetical protein
MSKTKLKKKQRKAIEHYVRYCADEMGLRDWTLKVDLRVSDADLRETDDHDGSSEVWGASCDPVRGRKYATIAFGLEVIDGLLIDDRRVDFRQTVAHELTHCHFAQLWELLRIDLLEAGISQHVYDVLIKGIERNMEYGVDGVADAIAPRLPLIDWT